MMYHTVSSETSSWKEYEWTRQLKTAHDHLMPPQHHLYNGLDNPVDYSTSMWEWNLQSSPCWHTKGWLVSWCLTALSAQICYIVPCEN